MGRARRDADDTFSPEVPSAPLGWDGMGWDEPQRRERERERQMSSFQGRDPPAPGNTYLGASQPTRVHPAHCLGPVCVSKYIGMAK